MPHLAAELPIKSRATSSIDIEAVMPIGAIFSRQYCTPGNGREEGVSEKKQHTNLEKTSALQCHIY